MTETGDSSNTATDDDGTADQLDLVIDESGYGTVDLSASFTLANKGAGAKVRWAIAGPGTGASATAGTFASTNQITFAPDGTDVATINTGLDANGNGQLDSSEISRTVDVHFIPTVTIEPAVEGGALVPEGESGILAFVLERSFAGAGPLNVVVETPIVVQGTYGVGTPYADYIFQDEEGSEYDMNSGQITVSWEASDASQEKRLFMAANFDDLLEGDEVVTLTLFSGHSQAGGYTIGDSFEASAAIEDCVIDLAIDSNGDGAVNSLDNTIEDDPALPGALVLVNDDDGDNNGITDYADPQYGNGATPPDAFTPLTITVPDSIDISAATFKFTYSASHPGFLTSLGDGSFSNPTRFEPIPGHLRVWTKDGSAPREPGSVQSGGHFVPHLSLGGAGGSGDWAAIGITDASRTATLYVEGIRASASLGDLSIRFEVDVDGASPGDQVVSDQVRLSAIEVNLVSNLRKRGSRYDNLSSVVGSYLNPGVPFDLAACRTSHRPLDTAVML